MPTQRCRRFLDLPRELREIIYRHYVQEKDGYYFDIESGKLRASGHPIDLSLMYTCKTVAAEMRGLPLSTNRVTFSSVYSESLRLRAGRLHKALMKLADSKRWLLSMITRPLAGPLRPPEVIAEILQKFPQFEQKLLDAIEDTSPAQLGNCFSNKEGQAASTHRAFINHALKVCSTSTIRAFVDSQFSGASSTGSTFIELAANWNLAEQPFLVRSRFLVLEPDPWNIASEDVIAELEEILVDTEFYDSHRRPVTQQPPERRSFWKRVKWRFSAAAAAIHFLKSVPLSLRLQIRDVLLLEDRESVAYPECHALGLIPFCVENSSLHVERRVSLWRNILPAGCGVSLWDLTHSDYPPNTIPLVRDALRSVSISDSFSEWITEALALPAAGMPPNAFSLVFDGHPTSEQSFRVFQVVKLEAAFQSAKDLQEARWPETLLNTGYVNAHFAKFETFPQVVRDIIEGRSNISCNFPMGDIWDANELLAEYLSRTHGGWFDMWIEALRRVGRFQTAQPLPPWRDLRLENLLPEVMSSTAALLFPANV